MTPNKILIIGISGTGKTRIAKILSDKFHIPIVHYDQLVWGEHWTEINESLVAEQLHQILPQEQRILEGYIQPLARERLQVADLIIYLDYTGWEAMRGGLQRRRRYRGTTRPEMASGCIERFDWNFLNVMLFRQERPEIEEALHGFEDKIVRLRSRKQADFFLKTL